MVVKKIKPSSQLSVFTNVNVDLLFLNPQGTRRVGCVSGTLTTQKNGIMVGNAADPRPETVGAERGHRKVKGEESGGPGGSDGIFQAL